MNRFLLVHVVDDDSAVRDSLNGLLRASGYNVRPHHCAASFFSAFDPEDTGCVLVDMKMPDATGAEVQDRIARIEDSIPVIIITGHANIRMAVSAMKRGAVEFLEKPVDPQILLDHVDKAIKRREYELCQREKAEEVQAKFGVLTPRERDVLKHLLVGRPNKIIARELGLSPRTVEIHRARVMEKTGAGSLPRLVRMALAAGLDPEATLGQ
jgi:two-component system, LuxR family, response regulator FixJ